MNNTVATFGMPSPELLQAWPPLRRRGTPNVFLHPAALLAASERFSRLEVLQAWSGGGAQRRLVGLWAIRRSTVTPLGPACIATPAHEFAYVSNPVLHTDYMDEAARAFLTLLAHDERLPGVMRLRYLDADCPSYRALVRALAARGCRPIEISRRARPYATPSAGRKLHGATHDKLRQKWNRLARTGRVELRHDREPAAVREAFETFLALEAAGWKGAHGTATASSAQDARFARQLVAGLAADGSASVALLALEDRPIAAQVVFTFGTTAYTWRTAYDEAFGEFSPGSLLVDRLTEQLFKHDGIRAIESCSPEGGFMNRMWEGRRQTVDLVADLRGVSSLQFDAAALGARGYAQLRAIRDALRPVPAQAVGRPRGTGGGQ